MTALLDRAIDLVRTLSNEEQDAYASFLLTSLDPERVAPLDEETRRAIREGLAQAAAGEFADDREIEDLLADRRA